MNANPGHHLFRTLLAAGLATVAVAQTVLPVTGRLAAYEQLGAAAARSAGMADLNWSEAEYDAFLAGLRAVHEKRPVPLGEDGRRLLVDLQRRVEEVHEWERAQQDPKLAEFMRTIRASAGLQLSDSGLLGRIIMPGAGPRPRPGDVVVVNLDVKMPDGRTEVPALSAQDAQMQVGDMPPGVNEALQMLALGGRGVFVVPPHLSFGKGRWPEGLPPGTPILLQIELKDILPVQSGR